ncbi:hypothetical protein LV779_02570 [Streptomyces thinghirensis]|nr:hypothetical protein [Streptomyces thinghirensis]
MLAIAPGREGGAAADRPARLHVPARTLERLTGMESTPCAGRCRVNLAMHVGQGALPRDPAVGDGAGRAARALVVGKFARRPGHLRPDPGERRRRQYPAPDLAPPRTRRRPAAQDVCAP